MALWIGGSTLEAGLREAIILLQVFPSTAAHNRSLRAASEFSSTQFLILAVLVPDNKTVAHKECLPKMQILVTPGFVLPLYFVVRCFIAL